MEMVLCHQKCKFSQTDTLFATYVVGTWILTQ